MLFFEPASLQALNALELTLLYAGRATVNTNWSGHVALPDFSRLYYILEGEAHITMNKHARTLSPGNWYLLPAGCAFDYACHRQMEHIFFHLKLCQPNGIDLLRSCPEPLVLPVTEADAVYFSSLSMPKTLLDGLQLRQALCSVLTSVLTAHNIQLTPLRLSPCTENAIAYINNNLRADLTLSQIAENTFVSRSTLTKHFRRELSVSVGTYVSDALLSRARLLIVSTHLPLKDISESLGYSDQFYFSRCFKEKFGISPQKFRQLPFV